MQRATPSIGQFVAAILMIAAAIVCTEGTAYAEALTWDIVSGDGSAITDGDGIWSDGGANWNTGSGDATWNNAASDSAVIGSGGTAGTISLASDLTIGDLTFNTVKGSYILQNSMLTLSNTPTITVHADAKISSILAGTGFGKSGAGMLTLAGANTYDGSTTISDGMLQIDTGAGAQALSGVAGNGWLNKLGGGALTISAGTFGALGVAAGTVNLGTGVTVGTADFNTGRGAVNADNPLTVTHAANLSGVRLSLGGGGTSFSLKGEDIIVPVVGSRRVITASSGTLTLAPPAQGTDGKIGGVVSISSSFDPATGVWTVNGVTGLAGPQGDNHAWHYTSMETGDFDIKVRVTGGIAGWQRVGLMVRDGLTQSANYTAVWAVEGGGGACAAYRSSIASAYKENLPGTADWLRITKVGMTITTYNSQDHGATYTMAYRTTYPFWGPTTYMGLDVNYGTIAGTFDNVTFLGTGAMPDWSTTDIAINGGAKLNLRYDGTVKIAVLRFDGAAQSEETWGATDSGAIHVDDVRFTGTGTLSVTKGPSTGATIVVR